MKQILILIVLAIITSIYLVGQQADTIPLLINTDRPTQAYSPYIIPLHTLQIESGISMEQESNDDDNINSYDIAGTQFRFGLFENLELRANTYYRIRKIDPKIEANDSTITGFGPLSLGFKVHVVEEKGLRPEIAIISNLTLRHLGNENFAPVFSYPVASLLFANTISKRFSIVYNTGFAYSGKNADGFFIYRFAINYMPIDRLVLFFEPYGNFNQGDLPNHKINGGLMFIARNNLQADISYGYGLSKDIKKSFISAGISWRLPK